MTPMSVTTSRDVRQAFLEFFEENQHAIVASSPLPQKDNPTLLFTNAGMNQFANVFLGTETRDYARAATAQKVMRVQGKHNDLENVGPSPRHHTFFEMLGNFSFGDYFKREAIDFAWTFLTQVVGLDQQRLWATVFRDDDEAAALWSRHLDPERILRFDEKDNFWAMGDTGPCGPCSEIHYYIGPIEEQQASGVNHDDAYLELWNLVFMQFNRDHTGRLTPLPRPSIDTGMSLERLMQVVQGVDNNYDTDLFAPVLDRIQALLEHTNSERQDHLVGYRVIADHGRAATFLIADGVLPGNVGQGYVLRMIIRRAARFGRTIGFDEPFLAAVARVIVDEMGPIYPELQQRQALIQHTLTQEETRFARTLDGGLSRLDGLMEALEDSGQRLISGDDAFNLYATHGLPLELTRDVAVERGFTVDEAGFLAARDQHALASGSGAFGQYEAAEHVYGELWATLRGDGRLPQEGVDYDPYTGASLESPIVALIVNGAPASQAGPETSVEVVTAATPFYVESGGEVSDTGRIVIGASGARVTVTDMRQPVPGLVVHVGHVAEGIVEVGQLARLEVDDDRRRDIRRNHTATHILHRELRAQLGSHVTQQGSLVAPDRLRFDFSHDEALDRAILDQIERHINDAILANYPVRDRYTSREQALAAGAMALFGEKYGSIVRTVTIGDNQPYSLELCGGLHVAETAEIGFFRFTGESAVGAGLRRVEAVTGRGAYDYVAGRLNTLERLSNRLNTADSEVEARIDSLLEAQRQLQKELETAHRKYLLSQYETLAAMAEEVEGQIRLLTAVVEGADPEGLRLILDRFRAENPRALAVLGSMREGQPILVAGLDRSLVEEGLHAGSLVREVARLMGGGGGGAPHLAQAGGGDPDRLPRALAAVKALVAAARAGR